MELLSDYGQFSRNMFKLQYSNTKYFQFQDELYFQMLHQKFMEIIKGHPGVELLSACGQIIEWLRDIFQKYE